MSRDAGSASADKRGPRGRSHGKSARSAQGAPLPPDGSDLVSYPLGCCVMIEVGGSVGWHMVLFRIGGHGAPHCSEMRVDPASPEWNSGLGPAREIRAVTVLRSCWPNRPRSSSDAGAEADPLSVVRDRGSVMQGHLSAGSGGSSSG
jgi:hypothetical protein